MIPFYNFFFLSGIFKQGICMIMRLMSDQNSYQLKYPLK